MEDQILNVHGFKSIPRAMIRSVFTTMSGNVIYYVHYIKPNGERDTISQQFMGPTADADSLELFELEVLRDFTPDAPGVSKEALQKLIAVAITSDAPGKASERVADALHPIFEKLTTALEEIRDYRGEYEDYIDVTVSLKGIAREALS